MKTELPPERPKDDTASPGCLRERFSTAHEASHLQLPAWRQRLGHYLDVPISRADLACGFHGTIDAWRGADLAFVDSRTDPVAQTRSAARISTDAMRQYVFHVLVDGTIETRTGTHPKRVATQSAPGILALDMGQPMQMTRTGCRVLAFFLPRTLLASVLPEPESIHGSVVEYRSPIARLIPAQIADLARNIEHMSASESWEAMRACALLIGAAFGKEAGLTGNARAAVRAAAFAHVRRYIDENLHESDLSPDSVLRVSQLSRPTLYRLFEHEGGLAAYIRNRRLSQAAEELRRYPHKAVVEIAYGLGFNSASDFNRAFRRAYEMSPLDFRQFSL
ncbi:helix-turn-helix domain-containing protein [Paraburkholderia silviterrae]|uniref:helix-turn-helix domain-containing protein n=1 Tax=Paraburkholderia silviterrae TaxID=2528715 RepID=UPI001F0DB2FC|nr:helix-turn-helix domain-containing protein [Paraburkholderia silviterrae]